MFIIRILVTMIQAILKVVADAFVEGDAVLIGIILTLALAFAGLAIALILGLSIFRRVRSR